MYNFFQRDAKPILNSTRKSCFYSILFSRWRRSCLMKRLNIKNLQLSRVNERVSKKLRYYYYNHYKQSTIKQQCCHVGRWILNILVWTSFVWFSHIFLKIWRFGLSYRIRRLRIVISEGWKYCFRFRSSFSLRVLKSMNFVRSDVRNRLGSIL